MSFLLYMKKYEIYVSFMENIFVVFIINNRYVRWEEFSELDILKDIFIFKIQISY